MTGTKIPSSAFANLPNQLTMARLVLAVVLFGLIVWEYYLASLVIFVIAAFTDWLDGFLARKYGLITVLGRMMDPFADKVIICGTFILLAAIPNDTLHRLGMQPWVAVLIVGRELLITALRSFLESEGSDFSANMSGKLKMVAQCAAVAFSLYFLSLATHPATFGWLEWTIVVSIWSTILLTIYSGAVYVFVAAKLMRA